MAVDNESGPPPKRSRLAASEAIAIFMHHTIATDHRGRMWPQHELHLHPDGQISVVTKDGEGPKHGKWQQHANDLLQLTWHYAAKRNVKTQMYKHIPNTDAYIQIGGDDGYQALLIPKTINDP